MKHLRPDQIEVLPTLDEASYEPPAPPGKAENKACSNCALWSHDLRCAIHAPTRPVFGFDNCGYHVPGKPRKHRLPTVTNPPLDPRLSGLGLYPFGTRCGKCMFYVPGEKPGVGRCLRVRQWNRVEYAVVEEYGCCFRYKAKR